MRCESEDETQTAVNSSITAGQCGDGGTVVRSGPSNSRERTGVMARIRCRAHCHCRAQLSALVACSLPPALLPSH